MFGSSDPLQVSTEQWLTPKSGSIPDPTWTEASRTCSGLATSVNYKFMYSAVGKLGNPQRIIVAAEYGYGLDSWTFRLASETAKQAFVFRVSTHDAKPS